MRWGSLERWGRPVDFYKDKSSLFTVHRPGVEAADETDKEEFTQIGHALRELAIGWIAAHSPQAKGRIERFFGTAQDRLVKGLRSAGANSLESAQADLEQQCLPQWNQTFTWEPANRRDVHRPLRAEHDLAAILSHVEERCVAADYTIPYQGKIYQIARADTRPGLRGGRVRVEQRLDGTLVIKFRQQRPECAQRPRTPPPPPATRAPQALPRIKPNWMEGFTLSKSPPLGAILADELAPSEKNELRTEARTHGSEQRVRSCFRTPLFEDVLQYQEHGS